MAVRKITPKLEVEILAKATEGLSSRAIAQWLAEERGVQITHQAVGKLLRQTRQTRAEVAQVVVREKLASSVVSDLDRLNRSLQRVARIEGRTHNLAIRSLERLAKIEAGEGNRSKNADRRATVAFDRAHFFVDAALKATDRVRALANTKLHFAGADADSGDEDELGRMKKTANDELLSRLDRLADRVAPHRGTPQGDPVT